MADVETKTDESAFDPVLDSAVVGFTDHKSLWTALSVFIITVRSGFVKHL